MKNKYLVCMLAFLGLGLADLFYLNSIIIPALWPDKRVTAESEPLQQAQVVTQGDLAVNKITPTPPAQTSQPESMPVPETRSNPEEVPVPPPGSRDQNFNNGASPATTHPNREENQDLLAQMKKDDETDQAVDSDEVDSDQEAPSAPVPSQPSGLEPNENESAEATEPAGKEEAETRPVLLKTIVIRFETGEYELSQENRRKLLEILESLSHTDDLWVVIDGHADHTGGDDYDNELLSQRRADYVAEFLEQQGIARTHMIAEGHGDSQPLALDNTPESLAKNRRAEIKFFEGMP